MKNRKPVTHLTLTTRQRRYAGLRSAQLGLSLIGYFARLLEQDVELSGLGEALVVLDLDEKDAAA